MAPVLKIILAVHGATFGAALTGVVDLEAAPEVAQTKSIKYELEPVSAKDFPSMQLLEGKGPCDVVGMTYSDSVSRFCRQF